MYVVFLKSLDMQESFLEAALAALPLQRFTFELVGVFLNHHQLWNRIPLQC